MKKNIFRYRVITNLECNQNPQCYFCYQPLKKPLHLSLEKCKETMDKVGILKRATIMGGESTLLPNLPKFIKLTREHVKEDVCLVTNGILLDKDRLKSYAKSGLSEVAISISSLAMYENIKSKAFLCKSFIPNTRINIPKCYESNGSNLVILLKQILTDGFYAVVCEDLQGRYGEFTFEQDLPAVKIKDDGYNFSDYLWNNYQFGVFHHYSGYDKSDIIITPLGNFCSWESYCKKIGNPNLK